MKLKNKMLSYENINQELKQILSQRLDRKQAHRFKVLVKALKEKYGFSISKQYIKYTLFDNKERNFQLTLSNRINRVLKKTEIKTEKKARFFKELKSEKGTLFFEYRKKYFNFLIV